MDTRDRYPDDCEDFREDGTEQGFCEATGSACTLWCLEDDEEEEEL